MTKGNEPNVRPDTKQLYSMFYDEERYERERNNHYKQVRELERQQELDRLIYARAQHLVGIEHSELKKPKPLTYDEKMNKKILSLSEIVRLTDALSLSITNEEERTSFDTIVRNWRDDRLKEIK